VFDLPDEMEIAHGVFSHIRLYTPAEIKFMMSRLGFHVECSAMESNNSTYRGKSAQSMYRLYEGVEQRLGFLRTFADTWLFAFRKNSLGQAGKGNNF
jgi:hypothetical protein